MATDPTRPSFTPVQRRLLTAVAGLVVAALAGAAFVLTYDVLRDLARLGGVSGRWAPLYPAAADTLTAMTLLSLVITRNARWWTRLPRWMLLVLLLAGGAAISVQDAIRGLSDLPRDAVRAGVAVAPHVMLVIAVWLWLTMFKQIRVARPVAEQAPPAEPQRGHVKILEPAAPEPLALEAAAEAEPEPASEPESPLAFLSERPDPIVPFIPDEPSHDFEGEIFEDEADPPEHRWSSGPIFPGRSRSAEPEPPPLDTLPEPRPPFDAAGPATPPALLPTDVELVRSRDRDGRDERRPATATTRPDIPMPGPHPAGEDEHDTPPTDRAEDPDAGGPGDGPEPGDDDWNPPPSGNLRSGPVPPAE